MKVKPKHKFLSLSNADVFWFILSLSVDLYSTLVWSGINSAFYLSICFPILLIGKTINLYYWFLSLSAGSESGRYEVDYFLSWIAFDIFIFVILLCIFVRPYNLAGEVFGYGLHPYAGKSSCTRDHETVGDSSIVYSTEGMFTSTNPYNPETPYAFCILNQRWASSSTLPIPGYARSSGDTGVLLCNEEEADGYMFSSTSSQGCGNKPYRQNLAYGLDIGKVNNKQALFQLTNASIVPCLTTLGVVDVDPDTGNVRVGLGEKILPKCLNSHRYWTGDFTGPAGYEQYTYDPAEPENKLCRACPGGPNAPPDHWLRGEAYSPESLQRSLVTYVILLSFRFIEIITHLIIYKSLKIRSKHEQQKKERSD